MKDAGGGYEFPLWKSAGKEKWSGSISRVLSAPGTRGDHSSWTAVARCLFAAYPGVVGEADHLSSPIWPCSERGLPCRFRRRKRGELLPHLFTLTRNPKAPGGMFSVALSVGSPPLGVTQRPVLWSSDFPHLRPHGRIARSPDPLRFCTPAIPNLRPRPELHRSFRRIRSDRCCAARYFFAVPAADGNRRRKNLF